MVLLLPLRRKLLLMLGRLVCMFGVIILSAGVRKLFFIIPLSSFCRVSSLFCLSPVSSFVLNKILHLPMACKNINNPVFPLFFLVSLSSLIEILCISSPRIFANTELSLSMQILNFHCMHTDDQLTIVSTDCYC